MTYEPASELTCAGCGAVADISDPFRCPNAEQGDIDHILRPVFRTDPGFPTTSARNPYILFRRRFHAYQIGRANGLSDQDYLDIVYELNSNVEDVAGTGFRNTRLFSHTSLGRSVCKKIALWLKDETANVGDSHKARHLFGVLLHLEILQRLGIWKRPGARLAIASCGNAGVAAATLAKAAGREIDVYVPESADRDVKALLHDLDANLIVCKRTAGVEGDPSYLAFAKAVAEGAIPFSCQGNQNGLAVEGGKTLGYELVMALASNRVVLDRLVLQVGGGAFASATITAFQEAQALGLIDKMPSITAVQTAAVYPLQRAVRLLLAKGADLEGDDWRSQVIDFARTHRSEFMWPWDSPEASVASGILDDETYDWFVVAEAVLATSGEVVLVSEEELAEANQLVLGYTGIVASATGTAGVAGCMHLAQQDAFRDGEQVATVLTGIR